MRLSYLILILLLALLLTALIMLGALNEIPQADVFRPSRYGSRRNADLYELWHQFQLALDSMLIVVRNWKLILSFFISLLATILTSLFAWKALQIFLTSKPRPVSPARSFSNPLEREVVGSVSPTLHQTRAWSPRGAAVLSGDVSGLIKVFQAASGFMLYTKAWRTGIAGKLGGTLSAVLILLGALILGTVYYELYGMIETHVSRRALTTAMNFSDAAAVRPSTKRDRAVHTFLNRYSLAEDVAYIFITDRKDGISAHNFPVFPAELRRSSAATGPFQRIVIFRGDQVLETGVPIDNGRRGMAYYGIWKAAIDRQVYHDLVPILGVIAVGIIAGTALSVFLARRITRPIMVLKEGADRMSRGEFDKPVGIEPFDDFGELATSLERLRSSLNAAFVRLNRE